MPNMTKKPDFLTGDIFSTTKWPDQSNCGQRWPHISSLTLLGGQTINATSHSGNFHADRFQKGCHTVKRAEDHGFIQCLD